MTTETNYDPAVWTRFLDELTPAQLRKALRSGLRREATRVKRLAVQRLRGTTLNVHGGMEKGIRTVVYRRGTGFKVTVKPKVGGRTENKGFHTNRRGQLKPVLAWAETGTRLRRTKTKTRIFRRSRHGHYTGYMAGYHFMADAEREAPQTVEQNLGRDLETAITKAAKKAGIG